MENKETIPQTQPDSNIPKKRKIPIWGKILIGIAIFIVLVIVIASATTSPVVKPAEEQLTLLENGKIEEAYNMTSEEFQQSTSLEKFKNFIETYPILAENKGHSFNERSFENNIGTVRGTLTAEDGTRVSIEYKLIKENGEWKILSVELNTTENPE